MRNPFKELFQCRPSEEIIDYELNEIETEDEHIPIAFKNDSKRLKDEYSKLFKKNPELFEIIDTLNDMANKEFGKNVLITMIYRTQSEQDYLYRNSAKYAARKFKSPHQFWHGVDLRSRTFEPEEIAKMVEYINEEYNQENHYRFTADYHTVGAGFHFHIQFARK